MGIKGLSKLLGDHAPGASREQKFDNYFGRKIAVDASMHIYQSLVVVGRVGDQMLTSEAGDVTSHILGMFNRTAKMLESGIKPIYVFDGKPPSLKQDELARRGVRRTDATTNLEEAKETATTEEVAKYSKRTVRVTKEHNDDCKRLLNLMGVPIIEAPSEAEAQCAAMVKAGLAYAMSSEDMDSLTFATPRLLRNLMAPASQKLPVTEYDYDKVLEELKLTADQFIDMCILCGCDYAGTIRGIGPNKALTLVQKHGSLEEVLNSLDTEKYPIPDPFPYKEAARLFKEPHVMGEAEIGTLKWNAPDLAGLLKYLVEEKQFSEDRVRKAVERVNAARGKSNQGRLEAFFGPVSIKKSTNQAVGTKRKEPAGKGKAGAAKKGKAGGVGKKN